MIDLGEWANDGYRIEGEPGSADRMSPEELDAAADRARELEERRPQAPLRYAEYAGSACKAVPASPFFKSTV